MSEARESDLVWVLAVGGFSATLGLIGFGTAMFTQIAIGWLPGRALDPNYRADRIGFAESSAGEVGALAAAAVPGWLAWSVCVIACLIGVGLGMKVAQVFLRHAARVGQAD